MCVCGQLDSARKVVQSAFSGSKESRMIHIGGESICLAKTLRECDVQSSEGLAQKLFLPITLVFRPIRSGDIRMQANLSVSWGRSPSNKIGY